MFLSPPALRAWLRISLVAMLCAMVPFAAAQEVKDKPKAWKLSTAVGPAFALGKAGQRWAKLIAEKSDGKLAVQLFPGAALAQRDPAREFLALRDGAADLAVGSTLFWAPQVNELTLIGLPWLAPDGRALDALVAGTVKDRLDAAIERAGGVPLALAALGHRALATTAKDVRTPEDLGGLEVRVTSTPLLFDLFMGLGAHPRAMAFADAETAFRAGTLNAQEGTPAPFAAARLDALGVRHVLLWGAVAEAAVFAVNRTVWDGFSDEQRGFVSDAAQQAARELPALVQAENDAALADLRKRGIVVTRLTATGQGAFAAAARGVYDKWAAVAGEDLVRAAEAAVKAAAPP